MTRPLGMKLGEGANANIVRSQLRRATTMSSASKTINGSERTGARKPRPITLPKLKCLEKDVDE